jgi:antibiotic biosynthesis monooxygenase (ABM) superfamily enzyme
MKHMRRLNWTDLQLSHPPKWKKSYLLIAILFKISLILGMFTKPNYLPIPRSSVPNYSDKKHKSFEV